MAKVGTQMVCIDCDEVFEGGRVCPACASRQVYPLGRWFRRMPEIAPMVGERRMEQGCAEMVAAWTR